MKYKCMKPGSCRIWKPKRMTCELEYKFEGVYKHAPRNVTDSTREEERPFSAERFVGGRDERRQTSCCGASPWTCSYWYRWVSPQSS
jgi:hypothetical protein